MYFFQILKYSLFELKNPIIFRIKYFFEKLLKAPVLALHYLGYRNIPWPCLFSKEYTIENSAGKWAICPHTDYDYIINPHIEAELNHFFITKKTFLDIGAHVGKWSIFVARQGARVISFEPNPDTFGYLQKNVSLNGLNGQINTINVGVSSSKGILKFLKDEKATAISRFDPMGNIDVDVISIDDYLMQNSIQINDIGLIKIDTETFEMPVLQGMQKLLKESSDIRVICEILNTQEDKKDIINYIESCGLFLSNKVGENYIFNKAVGL